MLFFFLEVPGKNLCPCFSRLLESAHILCPVSTLICKASNHIMPNSASILTFVLWFWASLPPFYNPCDYTGPSWINQYNPSILKPMIQSYLFALWSSPHTASRSQDNSGAGSIIPSQDLTLLFIQMAHQLARCYLLNNQSIISLLISNVSFII